jgi:hypothetical protein
MRSREPKDSHGNRLSFILNEGTRGNPVKGSSPAPQASRLTQSPLALPAPHSSDDDDPLGPTFVTSKSTGKSRRNKWHRAIPEADLKAAASPSAPADVPTKEQKAPKRPVKGQESPEAVRQGKPNKTSILA